MYIIMNGMSKLEIRGARTTSHRGRHRTFLDVLMVTFWESEAAIRAFAGDDISVAKYYDFDKDFLIELEPCSMHCEMHDK